MDEQQNNRSACWPGQTHPLLGEPRSIGGLEGWWQQVAVTYDVQQARRQCPNCGGLGLPWAGWFRCDGACQGKGLVADGRFFVQVHVPEMDPATYAWEP